MRRQHSQSYNVFLAQCTYNIQFRDKNYPHFWGFFIYMCTWITHARLLLFARVLEYVTHKQRSMSKWVILRVREIETSFHPKNYNYYPLYGRIPNTCTRNHCIVYDQLVYKMYAFNNVCIQLLFCINEIDALLHHRGFMKYLLRSNMAYVNNIIYVL